LEIELASRGIPFKKFGGIRFVETAHVKDVLAYLKVIVNPYDELSWRRILLLIEGIGEKKADEILSIKVTNGEKHDKTKSDELSFVIPDTHPKFDILYTKYTEFKLLYELIKTIKDENLRPAQKIADIIEYYKPILRRTYDDYPQREQDLDALVDIVSNYTEDEQMLNDLALDPPSHSALNGRMDDNEWVILSTIHSAKGLEWNSVFVIQLIDGKFPVVRDSTKKNDIEEERRLFYVAVTRAKERLFLTSTHGRTKSFYDSWFFTRPSRFVEPMLDGDLLDVTLVSTPFDQKSISSPRSRYSFGKRYDEEITEEDIDKF
jgi:DNA helicase-2/ATP-dependent DNA helicase PcrA